MKFLEFLVVTIEEDEKENLKRCIVYDNIRRGRIFSIAVILFEVVLSIIDISTSIMKVDNRFYFSRYLIMYLLMILVNILFWFAYRGYICLTEISTKKLNTLENGLVFYVTIIMTWGSIISLMDQKLYSQVTVFMVNMITCSVLFYFQNKKIVIPYIVSYLVMFLGLPFFQDSTDVLIGHYVNLSVFTIQSWLASRIMYFNYVNDFRTKEMLKRSNSKLEIEIDQNKVINTKLEEANQRLKELSLLDELTGIPNRRSFNNYLDVAFESFPEEGSIMSIIMMDIDCFKQFNDNYGHTTGDKVLINVAAEISSVVRHSMDFAARWGGEEFIYISAKADEKLIIEIAETIRNKVVNLRIPHQYSQGRKYVTLSFGTATLKINKKDDIFQCIQQADKALYMAKTDGRNCIRSFREDNKV